MSYEQARNMAIQQVIDIENSVKERLSCNINNKEWYTDEDKRIMQAEYLVVILKSELTTALTSIHRLKII